MSLQLAILYTSLPLPSSRKIVRVHNIHINTSTDPVVIFRHADADCMVTYLCKMAAAHALRNHAPGEGQQQSPHAGRNSPHARHPSENYRHVCEHPPQLPAVVLVAFSKRPAHPPRVPEGPAPLHTLYSEAPLLHAEFCRGRGRCDVRWLHTTRLKFCVECVGVKSLQTIHE